MPSTSFASRLASLPLRIDAPRVLGLCFVLGGYGLAGLDATRPWSTPNHTIQRLAVALRAGDVQALRTTPQLGVASFAEALVTSLGEQEYRRILELYRRVFDAGGAQYERLHRQVFQRGNAAFAQLPLEQQQTIARRSHDEWVWQHGNAGDPTVTANDLAPAEPSAELTLRLGNARLGPEERALLRELPTTEPSVAADPMLTQLAQRRDLLGRTAFLTLRNAHRTSGERALRALGSAAMQEIDARSRVLDSVTRGIDALEPADRALVGTHGPAAFLEAEAAERLRGELGRAALSPAERSTLGDRSESDFVRSRADFVRAQGLRLAVTELQRRYAGATYETTELRVRGVTSRDLLQRRGADAALAWSGAGAQAIAPFRIALRWFRTEREWRIENVQWTAPAGTSAPAPVESADDAPRSDDGEAR